MSCSISTNLFATPIPELSTSRPLNTIVSPLYVELLEESRETDADKTVGATMEDEPTLILRVLLFA